MPDSVLLWTRVTPSADALPGSGKGPSVDVRWEVAKDAAFSDVVATGHARTGPERDHTVKVTAGGLCASTSYHFRFSSQSSVSQTGRTRTAPAHDEDVARLRFGVVACANWASGHFAPYGYLAGREDLDAVIHLGDYLYEGNPNPAGDLRPSLPPNELVTLSDYRQRHAMYKTDEHLRRLHARHPMVVTWDDHESADNAWSGGSPSHDPATEGSWADRLRASHQAYFEWMPVRHRGDKLYRRLKFGKLVDLTMLDLRSYRTRQTEPDAAEDPAGTILGADQRRWFLEGLARGTASWNVVGNSVMVTPIKVPSLPPREKLALEDLLAAQPTATNTDQWDGYPADRRRVLEAIAAQGRGNTVFLTGDVHSSWANNVPRDGTSVAVEFVCPSVTSDNIDEQLGVPPRTGSLKVEAAVRALNPHVRFVELDSHGPGVLEVTPDAVRMNWYYVADRRDPATAVTFAHAFRTVAGEPWVRPASG